MRKVAAVVFDMDGLMLDTEPLYKIAWQACVAEAGYRLDDEMYERLVGRRTEECERMLIEWFGSDFPLDTFRVRWPQRWRREVERAGIQAKAGLFELLAFVEARRLPMAVATSSEMPFVETSLAKAGLTGRFNAIVTGNEVPAGKPAPDIYLEAARRLAVAPEHCVAFEDSEAGIRAAAAAGMIAILVPHWMPPSAAAAGSAYRVLVSLHDARLELERLLT
jgi:HAD superfamily hydrolase (TIGR01509 family)